MIELLRSRLIPERSGSPEGLVAYSPGRARAARVGLRIVRLGPVLILVLLLLGFGIGSGYFFTFINLQNLLAQSSIVMTLALGQFLVILIRGVDISLGAVVGFSGVSGALLAGALGGSGGAFIIGSLLAGAIIGTANGLIIVKGRLPQPFIVTLATMGVAQGIAQLLTGGKAIVGVPDVVTYIGSGYLGPIPMPVIVVVILGLALWYLTAHTQWGRWMFALGGSPEGASRMGLPVGRLTCWAFVIAGLCAAVGGIITAGRTNSAVPLAGTGSELDSIIAVVVGGASMFGGRGSIVNVVVGALILGTIHNGLDLLNVSPFMQTVVLGVIVVIALELDILRSRLEERVKRLTVTEMEK